MDLLTVKYKGEKITLKPPSKQTLEKVRDSIEILIINNICCTPEEAVELLQKHPDFCLHLFTYLLKKIKTE